MKIKGKIIAVLATLGLLLTMMSAIPVAGATAGTVTISGGVTNESVDWFSLTTNYNRIGVTVADADANIATALTGECVSGALTFKCELVGQGGEGTLAGADVGRGYTATNTPMVDRNADDIPDAVTVRSLQAQQSFLLSTASASAGTLKLAAATALNTYARIATNQISGDVAATDSSALSQHAKLEFTWTGLVDGDDLGAAGITITGKTVNPTTLVVAAVSTVTLAGSVNADLDALDVVAPLTANDGIYSFRTAAYYAKGETVSITIDWAAQTQDWSLQELETVAVGYEYDKRDTITGKVTINSTSSPTAVAIDVLEADTTAGKASGSFTQTVVLTNDISLNGVLCTQAKIDVGADPCLALTDKQLYVTNGDLITTSYADASPAATITDTARVDLTAPVITLLSPGDKSHTSVGTPTYSVQVKDGVVADSASSGITDTAIQFKLKDEGGASGGANVTETRSPVTRGFQVSLLESAARGEGALTWWAVVADKVGNVPASTIVGANEAKPYTVTFDYAAPTVATAETGIGIKNLGLDTEAETADAATSVKVGFTLGTAGKTYSPLDSATVSTSDFLVAGVAPSAAVVNKAGTAVYLTVATMGTDAKPKVELSGEVQDKAGNKRTSGTIATAADKLAPTMTATVSSGVSKEKLTITVTSSETLVATPTITVATVAAFNEQQATPTVSSTGVNTWTAEITPVAAEASKWWVKVLGTDINANATTLGDGTPTADIVTFQTDLIAPLATVTPTSVEAGDVFLRVVFDEDEGKTDGDGARGDQQGSVYTDAYKKVTLTSAKVKNTTTGVEEDVLAGFYSSDQIDFVLAKNLVKDSYELILGFVDEALNAGTKTQAITVTARAKTTISLTPGYNYISIPGNATSSAINDIIAATDPVSHVFAYDSSAANPWLTATRDATTGLFVGDVSSLIAGTGYIMKATAFVDLKVDIPTASYNSIPGINTVRGGQWSLIGLANRAGTAVDADAYLTGTTWSVCVTYDPSNNAWATVRPDTTSVTANNLAAKAAYFCYFRTDGTIVQQ